ncbi:hypothetical protein J437_LFUL018163, partial [Ladona fulva]
MKNEMKSGRRIANIVGQMMEADAMKGRYGMLTTNLLEWILLKTKQLSDHNFPNSLEGIQGELTAFKTYRTVEKPPNMTKCLNVFFSLVTFLGSWRSGLGFNALIHAHRPDLVDYHSLIPSRHIENLNRAFDVAQEGLGIPRLLDAE